MEKVHTTAAMLDDLHRYIPAGKDAISTGTGPKATNVRLFGQVFTYLPELIRSEHKEISDEESASLERIVFESRSQREMVYKLTYETKLILGKICIEYLGHLQYQNIPDEMREKFTKLKPLFRSRIKKIRPFYESEKETEEMKDLDILLAILLGGVINIGHVSWTYFNVIPDIVQKQKEEEIHTSEADEYHAIAKSVQKIVMNLISCQDDVFHAVDTLMRRQRIVTDGSMEASQNQEPSFYWELYHAEDFRLHERKLELSQTLIEGARDKLIRQLNNGKIHLDEPRVGCAGTILIPAIHQWCLKAAQKCFFPHMKHVKSLPIEIADPPEDLKNISQEKKKKSTTLLIEERHRRIF